MPRLRDEQRIGEHGREMLAGGLRNSSTNERRQKNYFFDAGLAVVATSDEGVEENDVLHVYSNVVGTQREEINFRGDAMIVPSSGDSLAMSAVNGENLAITPEGIDQCAAALGVKLAPERARVAANFVNPMLEMLARRAGTLRFESEPADFLVAIEHSKQR